MKKKVLVPIIICLLVVMGTIGLMMWNNRVVSIITMDINPSIQINLNKNNEVVNVIALNDDAKDIVNNNFKNKTLDETFEQLITKIIDKGYVTDNNVDVILHTEGNIINNDVVDKVEFIFGKQDVHTEVIVIEKITNEDKELAKKYSVSPAKVSYIKSITKDYENLSDEKLVNKSVSELRETKTRGKYCDDGYILEGDFCLKEISRKSASNGEVCPNGYLEYEGKCYEEIPSDETDKLLCRDDFNLVDGKCVRTSSHDAIPSKYTCTKGEAATNLELGLARPEDGIANDVVCVDTSNATHPVSPCETHDGTEYTVSGGKCYWHRAPVIEAGCPGKIQIGGMCWDDASNVLICEGYRDGKRYSSRSEYCENSIKYLAPTVTEYKCEGNERLVDNKCVIEEVEDSFYERVCSNSYTLVNSDRCINYNKTANKENGLVCDGDNTRLKGNVCITYEFVEAKQD